jgi:Cell division protein CrgA
MPKSRSRSRPAKRPYAPPPTRRKPRPSPRWYGLIVLGLMAIGVAMIVLNYMNLVPGGTNQIWLWSGLGLIALGFGAATRWR